MEKLTAFLARKKIADLFAVRDAVSALAEIAYKTGVKEGLEGAISLIEQLEKKSKKRQNNAKARAKKVDNVEKTEKKKEVKEKEKRVKKEQIKETNEEKIYAGIGGHIDSADIGRKPPKMNFKPKPLNMAKRIIIEPIAQSLKQDSSDEDESETIAKGEDLIKARQEAERLLRQAAENKKRQNEEKRVKKEEKKENAFDKAIDAIAAKKVALDKEREKIREKNNFINAPAIKSESKGLDMSQAKGANTARIKKAQLLNDFENWWQSYPSAGKKGKPKALAAYVKARLKASHEDLCRGRDEYQEFLRKNPDMPVKYGQGWLSEERWNDYHAQEQKKQTRLNYEEVVKEAAQEVKSGKKTIAQKAFVIKFMFKEKWEKDIKADIEKFL